MVTGQSQLFVGEQLSFDETRISKQVQTDDIEALEDFLEGGMTADQIMGDCIFDKPVT